MNSGEGDSMAKINWGDTIVEKSGFCTSSNCPVLVRGADGAMLGLGDTNNGSFSSENVHPLNDHAWNTLVGLVFDSAEDQELTGEVGLAAKLVRGETVAVALPNPDGSEITFTQTALPDGAVEWCTSAIPGEEKPVPPLRLRPSEVGDFVLGALTNRWKLAA
jgi:hypothetical protein